MALTVELAPTAEIRTQICEDGHPRVNAYGFVYRDGDAYAVYFASAYPQQRAVWLDVIFGTWDEAAVDDRVTFGCRVGPIEGQAEPACTLVDAAAQRRPGPFFGERLDRPHALAHPRLAEFWAVVDLLLEADPTVRQTIYEAPAHEA